MAWHVAAKAGDMGEGEVIGVVVEGKDIALYRLEGKLYATSNICTHEFATLSDGYIEDGCIECPLHQARFEIATGEVRAAPAVEPIKTFPVRSEGDQILVDLPDT